MGNITASILVPIDTTTGASAINYTNPNVCPILSLHCLVAGGTGSVKLTPLRSTSFNIGGSGVDGRIRIACDSNGAITTAEIAVGGTGYADGNVPITLDDPYGAGGVLSCTASGGSLDSISIVSAGSNYSGYILMSTSDFIEGITYDIIPRFIESTGGSLTLIGYRLSYRPYQVF